MLRAGHWGDISDYVTIHGDQELLFATRRALQFVEAPQFGLAESCQKPLVLATDHIFAIGLTKQQEGPFFVEVAQYNTDIFLLLDLVGTVRW